jgi:integrase
MTAGNITRRGKFSWRLKFEGGDRDPLTYKRRTRYVTVRGTKKEAQAELARLLAGVANGTAVDPSKTTVGDYLKNWLEGAVHLSPKTRERYIELAQNQIYPHLGVLPLQKLRPAHIADWHRMLLRAGSKIGGPLAARTVGHAHRVLHAALAHAETVEVVWRNVASAVSPPRVDDEEVECLTQDQIGEVLNKLAGHEFQALVLVALGTGMRRGELLALQWRNIDWDTDRIAVERSLEETGNGLRLKAPKSRHGRRTISLPASAVNALRSLRVKQAESRLALGLGRPTPHDLVFCEFDGSFIAPDSLSSRWRKLVVAQHLPPVTFHALRHTHASALISAGLDVLTVSRRLGHSSPVITLLTYGHMFGNTDAAAAKAIDAAMGKR